MCLISLKYKFQNFSTYLITWFFPKGRGKLFWKVYVYFRWVDDIVDDMKISQDYKRRFLNSEIKFLKSIKDNNIQTEQNYERKQIYSVFSKIKHLKNKNETWGIVIKFIENFKIDIEKQERRIKLSKFIKYSKCLGYSYGYTFYMIFNLSRYSKKHDSNLKKHYNLKLLQIIKELGFYSHLLHLKRDFDFDFKNGLNVLPIEHKNKKTFFKEINNIICDKWDLYWSILNKTDNLFLKIIILFYKSKFQKYL